jgi:NADPH2:quinone reductase
LKAIQIRATGGPEVLELVELPDPVPGEGEVRVRTLAIGVGMPDVMVRRGIYPWMPALPAILGIESAGVIDALGPGVQTCQVGQAVYINARDLPERSGGYAQFRVAPADAVQPLPAGVDPVRAAALGNYQVAASLLRVVEPLPEGATVAILGAAGGVGSALMQVARLRGLRVVAVAGSDEKCAWLRAQGADETVHHRSEPIARGIARCTGGAGASVIFDPVGGQTLPTLFEALAPLGTVVSYGGLGGTRDPQTVAAMMRCFGASPALRMFSMHTWDALPQVRREISREVMRLLAEGRIDPPIHARLPLAHARQAHELFDSHAQRGKIILEP